MSGVTVPGAEHDWDPLCSEAARASEEAFDAACRARAGDPVVRRVMAALNRAYDGDGYAEDEEGFRWLVVDASRVVAGVEAGRELNPDYAPDDRGYILDALADSGRLDPDEPDPQDDILDAIEAALEPRRHGRPT
jgi:hypothetical protein